MKLFLRTTLCTLAVFMLSACSDDGSKKVMGDFLSGCLKSGLTKPVCNCTYEQLSSKYSQADIKALNDMYVGEPPETVLRMTEDVFRAMAYCHNKR